MYDLIIVGGSAIGLFMANKFKERGFSVLVLEKEKEIGGKVCSGLVSKNLFDLLKIKKEEIKKLNFFEKRFRGARIWIENNYFDFTGRAYLLDRKLFDKYLFEKAKEYGVEIKLEEEVENVLEKEDFAEVTTKNGKSFQGKILAGCDGLNSTVAKRLGLLTHKEMLLGVIAYMKEQATDDRRPRRKAYDFLRGRQATDHPELFFSKEFPGFFAWRIPRKNEIEWGLALKPKYEPRKRLEKFLLSNIQHPPKENLRFPTGQAISNIQFKFAPIPLSPLDKTTTKRVFLCGDAAGQIKPHTGGGIIYGLTCAKIASEVINPQDPNLTLYEKEWRKEIMKDIMFGRFILNSYNLPNFIKKISLSLLKSKKNLDQDKPSGLLF